MSSRGRRSRRAPQQKGSSVGLILGGVGALLIVGFVSAFIFFSLGAKRIDKATGCPAEGYENLTVVLIDLTDPITPVQAAALRNALIDVRNSMPKFGRLEVYPLAPTTERVIEPIFAACSPGNAKDVKNRFYGNPELADRLWHKKFANRLDAVVANIQKLPDAQISPIFEGIQSVAVTAFGAASAEHAKSKRLIVISDMLQNTPELSMYVGVPAFSEFRTAPYYARVRPTLQDVNVDVFLIVRDTRHNVQQPPLYKFWVDYVGDAKGYLRDWKPLQ